MAYAFCINLPPIPADVLLNLPGLGELRFFRDELIGMPRLSSSILKILNGVSPVLSPIYSLIRVLDAIIAIIDCIKAIPKSLPFNPYPLYECFKKLIETFAALISILPPFSYIRLIADIISVFSWLVSDIASALISLEREWQRIRQTLAKAAMDNDVNLLNIGNCAKNNLNQSAAGIWQVIEALAKLFRVLISILEVIASLVPGPLSQEIQTWIAQIDVARAAIASEGGLNEIPSYEQAIVALGNVSTILNWVATFLYNILGLHFEPPVFPQMQTE